MMHFVKTLACLRGWKSFLWGIVLAPSNSHVPNHHLLLKRYLFYFLFLHSLVHKVSVSRPLTVNLENINISVVVSFWKNCFFKNKLFRNHQNFDMDLTKLLTPDEVSKFDYNSERSTREKWNPPKIHFSGDLGFFFEENVS